MIEIICDVCGDKFIKTHNIKRCSPQCIKIKELERQRINYQKNKKQIIYEQKIYSKKIKNKNTKIKSCKLCNKEFSTSNNIKIFCSKECYCKDNNFNTFKKDKQKRENKKLIKNCIICDNIFKTSFKREKCCSDICYKKFRDIYINKNKEIINEHNRLSHKKRRENNIKYKIEDNIRGRFKKALKTGYNYKINKYLTTEELIGCSIEFFKEHIEKQFLPGRTWENNTLKGWHIDHIIGICNFNLLDVEEQKKCFHYSNQQPLWAPDNLRKKRFIERENIIEVSICQ